jgi:UDP-glucose 4-epimerase
MKPNKVLVTGNKGFVGKSLCRYLRDMEIYVIDNDQRGNSLNIVDMDQLRLLENIDAIVHLAAKTSISNSLNNPYETYHINVLGTLNLLEMARSKNIRKFIYVSSYVYGQPLYLPVDERHPVRPHSPYNKSKLLAEKLCEYYSDDFGINTTTLRPFHLYGPGSNSNSFISSVIEQIKKNGIVFLSGKQKKRDFLFITDFVKLIAIILNQFPSGYNIYNVGYGASYTLEEVTLVLSKLLERKINNILYDELSRPRDVTDMKADISKVCNSFNWKPTTNLEEGLKITIQSVLC